MKCKCHAARAGNTIRRLICTRTICTPSIQMSMKRREIDEGKGRNGEEWTERMGKTDGRKRLQDNRLNQNGRAGKDSSFQDGSRGKMFCSQITPRMQINHCPRPTQNPCATNPGVAGSESSFSYTSATLLRSMELLLVYTRQE